MGGKIGGAAADVAEVVSPNAESLRAPDMLRHAQANALIEVVSQIDCAVPSLVGKIGGATADVAGRWMSDVEQNPTMPLIDSLCSPPMQGVSVSQGSQETVNPPVVRISPGPRLCDVPSLPEEKNQTSGLISLSPRICGSIEVQSCTGKSSPVLAEKLCEIDDAAMVTCLPHAPDLLSERSSVHPGQSSPGHGPHVLAQTHAGEGDAREKRRVPTVERDPWELWRGIVPKDLW